MAYLDLQVYHVAGLIATSLGGTLCKSVYRHPLPRAAPDIQAPYLCVYRDKEEFDGTEPGYREFTASIVIDYYLHSQPFGQQLEDGWGALHDIVRRIDQAIIAERHPSYESGRTLSDLAGIASIEVTDATFSGGLPEQPTINTAYPMVSLRARMIHHEATAIADETVLAKIVSHFDIDAHPSWPKTATLNAVGPVTATWTPVVSAVVVDIVAGGALSVAVAGKTATVTVVPGTTTYAALKLAWDADADALALATLDGTAGTVAAAYPGETLHLWYDSEVFGFNAVVTEAVTT